MTYLTRLHQANTASLAQYSPLLYGQRPIGLIWHQQIPLLAQHGLTFDRVEHGYRLPIFGLGREISDFLNNVIVSLRDAGLVPGWRNEKYALSEEYHAPPIALIERAAMPIFGGCGYGVHVNGITIRNGQPHIWIARRAWDKPTEPGKLDQIAAGGIPHGIDAFRNMQKECTEEAAISPTLSCQAKPVSTSSYFYQVENGIRADVLFNYDLWLPADFEPHNIDGEVAEFMCLPIPEVMTLVCDSEEFKFNASVVLIDLFVRHGYLSPDDKDYEKICALLNPRRVMLSTTFNAFRVLL